MSARTISITATLALVLALGAGPVADAAPRPARPSQRPAVEVIRLAERDGFDWSDAAIGAAGGLGLSMLALGGGLVIGARHRQHKSAVIPTRRYR
jgi:hypothetical protein